MIATNIAESHFAVVDVETTGLFPARYDRVIEIAIVRLSGDSITEEFVTLINPDRDLGPTGIHGISGRDVLQAPKFQEVAGDVLDLISGAVVVAHNVEFDSGFLVAECLRAGFKLPEFPKLCTLRLASTVIDAPIGRSLADCCGHFGMTLNGWHSAAEDARACAFLLAECLKRANAVGVHTLEDLLGCRCEFPAEWPQTLRSGKKLCRSEAQRLREAEPHYLARLVTRLVGMTAANHVSPNAVAYMNLLDQALEDRIISECEADALFQTATGYGLSAEQVVTVHRQYLHDLATVAVADGVVTDSERKDLLEVSKLLGFDNDTLEKTLAEASASPSAERSAKKESLAGKSVCFTGELVGTIDGEAVTREQAEELAAAAGMSVLKNVTKKLDILVVADPHTQSGKAKKARQYGTRILAERAFWNAIGVAVD